MILGRRTKKSPWDLGPSTPTVDPFAGGDSFFAQPQTTQRSTVEVPQMDATPFAAESKFGTGSTAALYQDPNAIPNPAVAPPDPGPAEFDPHGTTTPTVTPTEWTITPFGNMDDPGNPFGWDQAEAAKRYGDWIMGQWDTMIANQGMGDAARSFQTLKDSTPLDAWLLKEKMRYRDNWDAGPTKETFSRGGGDEVGGGPDYGGNPFSTAAFYPGPSPYLGRLMQGNRGMQGRLKEAYFATRGR